MLSVKQVANKLNLTEHTVRYYCDQGLIPTVQRNQQNERIFDDDSVEWLYGCKMLRRTGLSIKNIKRYVELCMQGNDTIDQRYEIMLNQKTSAIKKIKDAQQNLKFLNKKIDMYKVAKEQTNIDPLNPHQQ